jgi:hypothetical protein
MSADIGFYGKTSKILASASHHVGCGEAIDKRYVMAENRFRLPAGTWWPPVRP